MYLAPFLSRSLRSRDDFTANVTTDVTINNSAGAHIPLGTGYVGCYREATGNRALSRAALTHPRLTVGVCQDFCKGYRYYGLEHGNGVLLWISPPRFSIPGP